MSKTYIRTSDIFDHEDINIRLARYKKCFKIAAWLGIVDGKKKNDSTMSLYLAGSKFKVCLYYLLTVSKSDNRSILYVLKRILYIMR